MRSTTPSGWPRTGPTPTHGHPIARLGVGGAGVVAIDLVRDGPHALVAGTTGAGKSELLRTLVASIAAAAVPTT